VFPPSAPLDYLPFPDSSSATGPRRIRLRLSTMMMYSFNPPNGCISFSSPDNVLLPTRTSCAPRWPKVRVPGFNFLELAVPYVFPNYSLASPPSATPLFCGHPLLFLSSSSMKMEFFGGEFKEENVLVSGEREKVPAMVNMVSPPSLTRSFLVIISTSFPSYEPLANPRQSFHFA